MRLGGACKGRKTQYRQARLHHALNLSTHEVEAGQREFEFSLSYIVSFSLACLRKGGERMGQRREREKGKEAWLS